METFQKDWTEWEEAGVRAAGEGMIAVNGDPASVIVVVVVVDGTKAVIVDVEAASFNIRYRTPPPHATSTAR